MTHIRTRASAIIIKASQVLLMYRKHDGKEYWLFPGGGVEAGESPKQAVKREVEEETSLEVTQILQERDYVDPFDNHRHHYFVCEVSDGFPTVGGDEAKLNSPTDVYKVEWMNIHEALRLPALYPAPLRDHLKFVYENYHENKK